MDCLVSPLQDRLDEWKKTTILLDKDHAKEIKRLKQELKKRHPFELSGLSGTLKLQKRLSSSSYASGTSLSGIFSKSMESVENSEKLFLLEEMEKKSLRRVLIEERSRFCLFTNFLRPVVEEELAMLHEISHLQEIMEHLSKLTADPYILPPSSESVIADLKLSSRDAFKSQSQLNLRQSPPSSPSSSFASSRKSSMCSISSFNSNSSESTSPLPRHQRHSRHRKPVQMFDSRHIESLITYHPANSSASATSSDTTTSSQPHMPPPQYEPPKLGISVPPPAIPPRNSALSASTQAIPDACITRNAKDSSIYASSGVLSRAGSRSGSRPPPPPPARRTSSISDPEAITLGTLHMTGCSTYEEVKTLRRRVGSEANLYANFHSLCTESQPIYSNYATGCVTTPSSMSTTPVGVTPRTEYPNPSVQNSMTDPENQQSVTAAPPVTVASDSRSLTAASDDSLPPPPPEAYEAPVTTSSSSTRTSTGHRLVYNRISSVNREFMQTLNDTLANHSPNQRLSPRLTKRRSLSAGEHDWDSDSGIIPGSTGSSVSATSSINSNNSAQTLSLQQSLLKLMGATSITGSTTTTATSSSRPASSASSIVSRLRLGNHTPHVPRQLYNPVSLMPDDQNNAYQPQTTSQLNASSTSSPRSGSWPASEAAANASTVVSHSPRHSVTAISTTGPKEV